jgi:hypothetical protein
MDVELNDDILNQHAIEDELTVEMGSSPWILLQALLMEAQWELELWCRTKLCLFLLILAAHIALSANLSWIKLAL